MVVQKKYDQAKLLKSPGMASQNKKCERKKYISVSGNDDIGNRARGLNELNSVAGLETLSAHFPPLLYLLLFLLNFGSTADTS